MKNIYVHIYIYKLTCLLRFAKTQLSNHFSWAGYRSQPKSSLRLPIFTLTECCCLWSNKGWVYAKKFRVRYMLSFTAILRWRKCEKELFSFFQSVCLVLVKKFISSFTPFNVAKIPLSISLDKASQQSN